MIVSECTIYYQTYSAKCEPIPPIHRIEAEHGLSIRRRTPNLTGHHHHAQPSRVDECNPSADACVAATGARRVCCGCGAMGVCAHGRGGTGVLRRKRSKVRGRFRIGHWCGQACLSVLRLWRNRRTLRSHQARHRCGQDIREGPRAFAEKRSPIWSIGSRADKDGG